jgi:hypothetical protein
MDRALRRAAQRQRSDYADQYVAADQSGLAAVSTRTVMIEPSALLTPVIIASLDPTAAISTPRNLCREPRLVHQHQTSQPHPYRAPANFERFCYQNDHHVPSMQRFTGVSRTRECDRLKLNRLRCSFSLVEHDLIGNPVSTFPDHALNRLRSAKAQVTKLLRTRLPPSAAWHRTRTHRKFTTREISLSSE